MQGLRGIYRIADNLLITGQGDTKEDANKDHDANFVRLLQNYRERYIRLNKANFDFKCQQVTFIGLLLSSEGIKPDPRKIDAIGNMETPVDVQGVQCLIGMVKYLSKLINLSELCQPLHKLTHKDAEWQWTHAGTRTRKEKCCNSSFNKIIASLSLRNVFWTLKLPAGEK